jgi:hypothetical protein
LTFEIIDEGAEIANVVSGTDYDAYVWISAVSFGRLGPERYHVSLKKTKNVGTQYGCPAKVVLMQHHDRFILGA